MKTRMSRAAGVAELLRSLLRRCTNPQDWGCERTGSATNLLNPINSARIRTVESFSFTYGRVEVRAKLPAGDWTWPGGAKTKTHYLYETNRLALTSQTLVRSSAEFMACDTAQKSSTLLHTNTLQPPTCFGRYGHHQVFKWSLENLLCFHFTFPGIIRAWFNRFAAQPRQCIFKEKILFSVSITFV
jgi:hypothetical protein